MLRPLPADFAALRSGTDGATLLDGAVRVFGEVDGLLPSLATWNDDRSWVGEFGDLASGLTFFAEDAFGNQFGWNGERIVRLAAESGRQEPMGKHPRAWWQILNSDPDAWAVAWLHDEWVASHGSVPLAMHLAPTIPFVLKSEPIVENLFVVNRWENMSFKASLATHLRDAPPGTKVRFRFDDDDG
jgi:hypothetical protein